jgi:hypothetical protein
MKICQRYPYPKSFPSGKGLAIASLKVFAGCLFYCMFVSLFLRAKVVQKYENFRVFNFLFLYSVLGVERKMLTSSVLRGDACMARKAGKTI